MNDLKELKKFARSKKLIPILCNTPGQMTKEYHERFLEHLGFVISEEMGDTFFHCKFPKGWKLHIPPRSENWVYIMDEKRRPRGTIYFKIIEKSKKTMKVTTFINYMPRFRIKIDRVVPQLRFGKQQKGHKESPLIGYFYDGDKAIYETGEYAQTFELGTPDHAKEEKSIRDSLYKIIYAYGIKLKPNFESIEAYWEEE